MIGRRSLRARLWLGAAISIAIALVVAAAGLSRLFEAHVERRLDAELDVQLDQLVATLALGVDGQPLLTPPPTDPRFDVPLSGRYWQIDGISSPGMLRSRSLWDGVIALPPDPLRPGQVHAHRLPGPDGQRLLVRERLVLLRAGDGTQQRVRVAVAMARAELVAARNAFAADMLPYLLLMAVVLAVATLVQVHTGLAPLERVRLGVEAIRSGHARRLAEHHPEELRPLIDELNALLDARAQALERARAWTADLAHGLKTPLSALAGDAERLRARGEPALAADLEQLAETMRRRVDRELIRARVRSGARPAPARAEVGAAVDALLRTLERTPAGRGIDWQVWIPPEVEVALTPDDLLELLGNLLENAAKWARSSVRIEVEAGERVSILIIDDGPGVAADQCSRLGERGLRLDERKEGTGLGLAIVRDIVDAYGGGIGFEPAERSGLMVRLSLPQPPSLTERLSANDA
ncbi:MULTISPECIES: HAMP domain-containing sensor histidine kinase [Marichromatium]|uniref:histidine kinase n=1 Tax=Marichromatium gracile TaxID=1048 RepID=A0A4R4AL58_MARGR|nr:histidine kinase [Marichromatium gracile]RNE88917.1 sensor histidine kinase [Marichromatium sp. AB31]RNE91094.1 sensor histidine kinase [Marichromatium sp. AB32]TCW40178.1 signal transduction histidine kinase [Marichromatium gracile]